MDRIPEPLLRRMADALSSEDRDEQAIPSYLHPNPAMRWMAWRRVEVIARHLREAARQGGRRWDAIMDFGCGTGVLLKECGAVGSTVYGVDLVVDSARLLCAEWGLDRVRLMTPDEADAVVPEGSVDAILAAEVLEHVEPLGSALARFRRWLRPGGHLLVTLPTESGLYRLGRRLAGFRGHYHHANAASIHAATVAAGFVEERLEKIPIGGPLAIYWAVGYRRR